MATQLRAEIAGVKAKIAEAEGNGRSAENVVYLASLNNKLASLKHRLSKFQERELKYQGNVLICRVPFYLRSYSDATDWFAMVLLPR